MNPSADVLALSSIDVDLTPITEGQALKTEWRKQPVFIRHLTAAEIQAANADRRRRAARSARPWPSAPSPKIRNGSITLGVCTPPRLRAAGRRRGRE
jgi:ubiquinol-cytochrome c reductase iron-sulfur subunit